MTARVRAPDNVKGRPPVPSRESGPDACSADITTASVDQDGQAAMMAAALARAIDPDAEIRYWLARCREAYQAGVEAGLAIRIDADEEAWRVAAGRVRVVRTSPTHAETEARRWTVRGEQRTRETYGRPHPDDYTGGPVQDRHTSRAEAA